MKQKNFLFKSALLLVALFSGASASWADVTPVEIPQNMGIYIPISTDGGSTFCSYIDGTEINRQNNLADGSTYYTIGCNQNKNVVININVKATVTGDYVFGFKTGASNSAASTLDITITKSGESPVTVATGETVTTNGDWNPTIAHKFYLSDLEKNGEYTISIAATKTSGSYCGNFGLFYFHTVSQYDDMPLAGSIANESTHIDLSDGTFYNCKYNNDKVVSNLDNGGYMDNVLVYNTADGYYKLLLNTKDQKANGTLKATIYDFKTGTKETEQTIGVTEAGDKEIIWPVAISPGLKRLRFDFTGTQTGGTIFNYWKVTTAITKYSLNEAWDYSPIAAASANVELTRGITAGKWSTIVLPFAMTSERITTAFGEGTQVAQLTSFGDDKLGFTSVTETNANEPYLIKVASDFSSATIEGVTIVKGTPSKTSVSGIDFIGSYDASTNIPASGDGNTYYFISNNALYSTASSGTANTIKGTRAYFKVPGTTGAKGLTFSVDDETTGVAEVRGQKDDVRSEYFDLQGRKVAQPTKGLYIVNGKKVIIK